MLSSFLSFSPLFITSCTAIIVMLTIAIKRQALLSLLITFIGLLLAFLSLFYTKETALPEFVQETLSIDLFATFYIGIILIAAMIVVLFAYPYFKQFSDHSEEFYLLILLATVGAMLLVCSVHFIPFFLGLELLSVPTYGLLAYTREHKKSIDAGLKYLILSATASATLLFGMAIIYARFGSLQFSQIAIQTELLAPFVNYSYLILGATLMIIAIAFKLSIAPFHQWAPDVYENAPAPVTLFLATIAKVAVFAVFLRFIFELPLFQISERLYWIVAILAIASMLIGNLFALKQTNYVRMLALSSVSHMGYTFIAVLCLDLIAANLYLMTYLLTSLAAFGTLTLIATQNQKAVDLKSMKGLYYRQPICAITLTIMLLSFAGIPLTLGFIAKLTLVFGAVKENDWLLIAMLIIGSGISLFYYLKAIIPFYKRNHINEVSDKKHLNQENGISIGVNKLILLALSIIVILFGLYPDPILNLVSLTAHF